MIYRNDKLFLSELTIIWLFKWLKLKMIYFELLPSQSTVHYLV